MKKRINLISILLVLLLSCQREYTEPAKDIRIQKGDMVYPGSTHIFDEFENENFLIDYSPGDGKIIMKKNEFTAPIEKDHVLMIGPSENTPFGALRKVTSIDEKGETFEFSTVQGNLNEAIIEGEIVAELNLNAANLNEVYALNGIKLKSASQTNMNVLEISLEDVDLTGGEGPVPILLNGKLEMDINPKVNMNFAIGQKPKVKATIESTIYQNISLSAEYEMETENEVTVYEAYFHPIVIWGVVLIPKFELIAGYEGDFRTQIGFTAEQRISKTYVVSNTDEEEPRETTPEINEGNANLELDGEASLRVYTGPQMEILVFGAVGPYVNLTGGFSLNADIHDCPWWTLNADIGGTIGLESEIFDIEDVPEIDFQLGTWLLSSASGCHVTPGTINGSVTDANTGNPLGGVTVKVGNWENNNFSPIATTTTNTSGNYSVLVTPGDQYSIQFTKTGYQTLIYPIPDPIGEGESYYLGKELQIDNSFSGNGSFGGTIVNAFTGNAVEGVTLDLLEGKNSTSNQIIDSEQSNSNGQYVFNEIPGGHYTIKMSKNGFITDSINVICLGGQSTGNQNGTLSPEISDDEWRIVLTWSENPDDLDSHLTGPDTGNGRFHIAYFNEEISFPENQFSGNLDVDDRDGEGPETITLKNISNGVYRYSVHDFSNKGETYSLALANSEARVIVFNGGRIVEEYNVPNIDGTLWTVFEIENNQLNGINTMEYESDQGEIKSATIKTDKLLFKNLPTK